MDIQKETTEIVNHRTRLAVTQLPAVYRLSPSTLHRYDM